MSQVCLIPSRKFRELQECGPGAPVFLQPLNHHQQITFCQSFIFYEETKPSYKILKGEHSLCACVCPVAQLCLILSDPVTVAHQALLSVLSQARILEWVAISFSRACYWPRDQTHNLLHRQADALPLCQYSLQFSSVTQSCPTLCDPMNCSTPRLPVHHQLLEFTQTHVHRVGDAIQPSHPLSSPSPPAPNPSQHQGLFQWVSSLHEVAEVLEFQLQHQSFQWTPRTDLI